MRSKCGKNKKVAREAQPSVADVLTSPLLYVVNLEMDNSLTWVLLNTVSGQITSDVMWM